MFSETLFRRKINTLYRLINGC